MSIHPPSHFEPLPPPDPLSLDDLDALVDAVLVLADAWVAACLSECATPGEARQRVQAETARLIAIRKIREAGR